MGFSMNLLHNAQWDAQNSKG